jgi:hypothetical protein
MKKSSGLDESVHKTLRHEMQITNASFKLYEAELTTILGTDNITVKILKDALQKLNLPLSGLKHERAERLSRYHRILPETPTVSGLAYDYIVASDKLDDDVDCE